MERISRSLLLRVSKRQVAKGEHILFNHHQPVMLTCVKFSRHSLLVSQHLYFWLLLPSYRICWIRGVQCQQQKFVFGCWTHYRLLALRDSDTSRRYTEGTTDRSTGWLPYCFTNRDTHFTRCSLIGCTQRPIRFICHHDIISKVDFLLSVPNRFLN
jgi:hypothetical protein